MARRSMQLVELGALLREMAQAEDVAIVVANQVADRFSPVQQLADAQQSGPSSGSPFSSSQPELFDLQHDPMTLEHQQRWITGWGDDPLNRLSSAGLKTPSLGLVWTNQLSCRLALTRRMVRGKVSSSSSGMQWERHMKVVFAPWTRDDAGSRGTEFVISKEGVHGAVRDTSKTDPTER